MKSFLTSLIGWKSDSSNSKNLPKGTRDYYSARESLGEEMRDFRKNVMPKLVERAGKKIDANEKLPFIEEQKEFDQLISKQRIEEETADKKAEITIVPKSTSHATIHPIYGQTNRNAKLIEEQSNKKEDDDLNLQYEPVYRNKIEVNVI